MNPLQWYVLVEENVSGYNDRPWKISQRHAANDFEHALSMAQQVALSYQPEHPKWPKSRSVFRTRDGGWLVELSGATANFHFRVSVAEYCGEFPGEPRG
jgi:hypothetical protein